MTSNQDEDEEVEVSGTTRQTSTIGRLNGTETTTTTSTTSTTPPRAQLQLQQHNGRPLKCRLEKDLYLDFEEYKHSTCASCYNQFPRDLFKRKLLYSKEARIWLYDNQLNRTLLPNETQLIRRTFQDEAAYDKWRACCETAVECCKAHAAELPASTNSLGQLIDERAGSECPATWDGLACWPSSPGGQLAWRECPRHVYFLSFEPACTGHVSKQCFSNGSWFVRNDHEWSDYSHCVPMAIYVRRMLFSVAWHIISALVITPALLTINKFSGRGGNKRVKILRNLLFWLLISSCIQAAKNSGIVSGLFEAGRPNSGGGGGSGNGNGGAGSGGSSEREAEANLIKSSSSMSSIQNSSLNFSSNQNNNNASVDRQVRRVDFRQLEEPINKLHSPDERTPAKDNSIKVIQQQQQQQIKVIEQQTGLTTPKTPKTTHFNDSLNQYFSRLSSASDNNDKDDERDEASWLAASSSGRCKREASAAKLPMNRRGRSSPLVIFFCWSLVVAERIARLMGYSWMFTGAIYLCSALHFAPAEPPAQAIRWLMFLTNAFPIVIALVYVTSRTIVEPSPLNIIFQVPYYKLIGDKDQLDYLWSTQLDCWLNQPKNERIEDIADLPNLILVCLNVSLFIITLIILCRINRPGSTRPDMSPLTYFKAAGTLVVLYGGHYALLAYRPNAETCYYDIIMAYAFLFVDGIQGIAVSYVFCYRTQEGKEIIWKYWRNKHEHVPFKWCKWLYCRNVHKLNVDNGHLTGTSGGSGGGGGAHGRSNHQSTRSNNSTCNGHETVTELININDTPVTSNNKF